MLSVIITLLFAAPARPADTMTGELSDNHNGILERGNAAAEVVYLLASGVNCEFQPYQIQG